MVKQVTQHLFKIIWITKVCFKMRITHDICQLKSDTALLIDYLKGNEPTKFKQLLVFYAAVVTRQ